jgi:hypothetical protein
VVWLSTPETAWLPISTFPHGIRRALFVAEGTYCLFLGQMWTPNGVSPAAADSTGWPVSDIFTPRMNINVCLETAEIHPAQEETSKETRRIHGL